MKTNKLLWVTSVLLGAAGVVWLATRAPRADQGSAATTSVEASRPAAMSTPTPPGSAQGLPGTGSTTAPGAVSGTAPAALATTPGGPGATPASPAAATAGTPASFPYPAADNARSLAELLSQKHDLTNPAIRARVEARARELEQARQATVQAKARRLGLPLEGDRPGGGRFVLVDFEGDQPVYEKTENLNAAISSHTQFVRGTAPFSVNGTGMTLGLWEAGGIPRTTHQEFGPPSRITVIDGTSTTSSHATHVAGTLIATGVVPSVRGMAPGANIVAYSSTSDSTEMLAAGAASPGQAGKVYVSNHSYGFDRGWEDEGVWVWVGTFVDDGNPANDVDQRFGRYDSNSATWDGLTYNLPYYLPFISAGNHGNDGPPAAGQAWRQGTTSGTERTYSAAAHPAGDGAYKGGYDTCEGKKLAKNVVTVGATLDAVVSGERSLAAGTLTAFSSTGPVDDGRIKPDVVANGNTVTSSTNTSDTSTGSSNGTSMASPTAAGSAILLQQYYGNRFPGQAMRASTLKALILHTADDIGNPGPDYRYGWGLMNTLAAATLIKDHADASGTAALMESSVSTAQTSRTHIIPHRAGTALRVTLCWTDPAGTAKTSGHDVRTRDLVNDLNLTVTGPGGATHLPYVMPHVGVWTNASLSQNATTGVNTVDNVEQVYLAAPTLSGDYTVTVNYSGSLTNGAQDYSLIVTHLTPQDIDVQQPAGTAAVNGGNRDFGSVLAGASTDLAFTLLNTGAADLTGVSLTRSGTDAGRFAVLTQPSATVTPGGSTTFTLRFTPGTPGPKTASLSIASNDPDENPYTLTLTGTGLTPLEAWRLVNFGTSANTGNAADSFDDDGDGLPNLAEFAFGLNPRQATSRQLPQAVLEGGNYVISFTTPQGVAGISYAAEWSRTLAPEGWQTVADTGTGGTHAFSIPATGGSRIFVRYRVTVLP